MKILITGAAGFIGFNLVNYLLNKSNHKIIGIDNLNDYYSVILKKKRLSVLKKSKNFNFLKIDINKKKNVESLFRTHKFDIVFNLAAQAGVRYSIDNPAAFVENNISGFYNILDASIKFKVKKLLYASSSSVYGDSTNFPLKEDQKVVPKNIYGLSKKINEEISQVMSLYNDIQLIGLRFFTVYGEWGRPDMFMMKYLKSSFYKNNKFYLNNFGKHVRDWTYVKDICQILNLLIKVKPKKKHVVYNVCSNKPVKLMSIISKIDVLTKKKAKITKRILQKGDIYKTHGSNSLIKKITKFKNFTNIDTGLKNTVNWYIKNKI
ncbi:NAD-dependent epimerase/dehydratase family protein [Candidatus Pelagibacter ubique]|nr:NAD-dependent epimerase/dehydratase family protein [Candidatus Pelagibacter ubique]